MRLPGAPLERLLGAHVPAALHALGIAIDKPPAAQGLANLAAAGVRMISLADFRQFVKSTIGSASG